MKKVKKITVLNWLKDVGLKSFAILVLVVAGFTAYAQINFPADAPNDVSGVVGMFVGESDGPFDNSVNSYYDANILCRDHSTDSDIAGSHICTPDEIINSYNHGELGVSPVFAQAVALWVNNGPPAFTANANDCGGWGQHDGGPDGNKNFGTQWNFDGKRGLLKRCEIGAKFACCK